LWNRFLKEQRGSATLIALLAMIVLASITGAYLTTSSAGLSTTKSYSYGEGINAQAAAEAGIKYAWANALYTTPDATRVWNYQNYFSVPIHMDSSDNTSPTFTITVQPVAQLPADVSNSSYYQITSVGTAGTTTRSIQAYILVPGTQPPTLLQLIAEGHTASGQPPWGIINGTYAEAVNDENTYQEILFGQQVSATNGFTLQFQVNLVNTNPDQTTDCGYGIYYLASGNPNNMSAYVLQYDPGLSPQQILVKKVIASTNSTTVPWANEIHDSADPVTVYPSNENYSGGTGNQSWQATNTATSWNTLQQWTSANETNIANMTLLSSDSTTDNHEDTMTVPMDMVMNQLNNTSIQANGITTNQMNGQNHILTIDVHNGVHRIFIDELEILHFVDRSSAPFTAGYTGLRVWESQAQFSNLPGSGELGPIIIRSWGNTQAP